MGAQVKRLYPTVDAMKLFFAIAIVFMHTYCHDFGILGERITQIVSQSGVPFFFICSGFFFNKGLNRCNDSRDKDLYLKRYLLRVLKMYISWTIITLPIAVYIINKAYLGQDIFFKIVYWIRMFLLVGSIGVYWYLLAMLISALLIYYFMKINKLFLLFVISFFFFVWGIFYYTKLNVGQLYFEWIHILFGSPRNFLNVGLFYMLIGNFFSILESRKNNCFNHCFLVPFLIISISIFIRYLEVKYLQTSFGVALIASACFYFSISYSLKLSQQTSFAMRFLSIGIYLLHFPFILVFDFYLSRGTIIDFPVTLLFAIVIYFILKLAFPSQISRMLLGQ
jgi:serine/alanine racemase